MSNLMLWCWFVGMCSCLVEGGLLFSPPNAQNEYALIQSECIRQCSGTQRPGNSVCYIAHPTDCFKFVICIPLRQQRTMYTQVMSCAFGTMWKNGPEAACERADLVQCINDPCLKPNTTVYDHPDSNCRTHYMCVAGRSMASCCGRYQRFDTLSGKCINDYNCDASCPYMNDATCQGRGVKSVNMADDNCKTYWECREGRPHSVCCPDGQWYDVFASSCMPNVTCIDRCPENNTNQCSMPNVKAYILRPNPNCRTYMKCSTKVPGRADPFCCRSGMMFDERLQKCVDAKTRACINKPCPDGYEQECGLEAIVGNPYVYKNLDAHGGRSMPCPVGTVFIQDNCQCGPDPTIVPVVPGIGECRVAVHAIMPGLKNKGNATAALLRVGNHGQGESGVGNMTTFWDGDDGINIPYFGSQAPSKLYIEISFQPARAMRGSPVKQVLLSTCRDIGNSPSLEVSLITYPNRTGVMTTRVNTPGVGLGTTIDMTYTENQDYNYKLIYDGTVLGVILALTNQVAVGPQTRAQMFSGNIPIHRSGLRLAKCRYEDGVSGFIGYVSEIKISKCLRPEMKQDLSSVANAV